MAGGNNIRAGGAYVEISANSSALEKGLQQAKARLDSFAGKMTKLGTAFTAAGAAVTLPFVKSLASFESYGDEMAKMAQRTGIGVDVLSGLSYAAQLSGTSIDTLEKSLKILAKGLVGIGGIDLEDGVDTSKLKDALKEIGMSSDQIARLSPEEKFLAIADAIRGIPDPMQKTALALKIFGRAGTELIPLMDQGSTGIREMMKEAAKLGIVLDAEAAQSAVFFHDQLTRVKKALLGVELAIAKAVAPAVSRLANVVIYGLEAIKDFAKEHERALKIALAVGAGLTAIGATFLGLAAVVKIAGFAVVGFQAALAGIQFGLAIAGFAAFTAAVLLGLDAVLTFSGAGSLGVAEFFNSIVVAGKPVKTWMEQFFGNLLKGFDVVVAGFVEGWNFIVKSALDAGGMIYRAWIRIVNAIADGFGKVWEMITGKKIDVSMVGGAAIEESMAEAAKRQKEYDEGRKKRADELNEKIRKINEVMAQAEAAGANQPNRLKEIIAEAKKKADELAAKLKGVYEGGGEAFKSGEYKPGGYATPEYNPMKVMGSFSGRAIAGMAPTIKYQQEANKFLKQIADNTAAGTVRLQ